MCSESFKKINKKYYLNKNDKKLTYCAEIKTTPRGD